MPRSEKPQGPAVTIVGGGISGLTAALRLAQRGYRVTVYEKQAYVGGNLGAYHPDLEKRWYDVYTHMYSDFYHNFWEIAEGDLGLRRGRGEAFEPRSEIKYLKKGKFPRFQALAEIGSPASAWQNLLSGVVPPADMLLWMYSMIDVLSVRIADDWWDELSVAGYLETRPCDTAKVNALHESMLMTIWSVHSSQVSMAAYRRFMEYRFRRPTPLLWLLTGNVYAKLIEPLQEKIESYGGTIKPLTAVTRVRVREKTETGCQIEELTLRGTKYDPHGRQYVPDGNPTTVTIDHQAGEAVILAVPPAALYDLIVTGEQLDETIYFKLPQLSRVRELSGATIVLFGLHEETTPYPEGKHGAVEI